MRRPIVVTPALLFAVALAALPSAAQTAWDAPPLISHAAPSGASVFVLSPTGGDLGGLVTFRHEAGPVGLGYRASISDDASGDGVAVAGGIDISGFLSRGVEDAPLDLLWWSGIGAGIGNETVFTVPIGAVIGWSGRGSDVVISPYAGGHLALDIRTGPGDNVRLGGSFDLGIDLDLDQGWLVRFGASVGDRDAVALGVRLPS
ncbi:MAG: hypothetical protein AAF389_12690 [Gemmatimonadota bacterium]